MTNCLNQDLHDLRVNMIASATSLEPRLNDFKINMISYFRIAEKIERSAVRAVMNYWPCAGRLSFSAPQAFSVGQKMQRLASSSQEAALCVGKAPFGQF